jgi:transposase
MTGSLSPLAGGGWETRVARRSFDVIDITEILVHWYAGRSQHELADSLGVDRKTIRKYIAPAVAAGMAPGGPAVGREVWAQLVREWFPNLVDTSLRQVSWPEITVHRDYIAEQLAAGVTAATIHQRLRDERGLGASVASLRRWIRANLDAEFRRAQVTVLGEGAEPGSLAQVDYGKLGMWVDPASGKRVAVWAFVMVLACSRYLFLQPVIRLDQASWTQSHVDAFAFFGGVPARIVPDNLRTGVERADLYDPKLNRSYAELAEHYGVLVDPARRGKPKDKPQVERPIPYVRDSFWRGRQFVSLPQMQADARRWCAEVAGARRCRPLDGAAPRQVFAAVEAPALGALPARPFVLATWSTATVGPDIHIKAGKTLYSVPWRHIGAKVDVRTTATTVEIFCDGQPVATHGRKPAGKQTVYGHYPPEKIAFAMRTPTWCRTKAADLGPACTQVIGELLAGNALSRLRSAQGILRLADRHTPTRLEAACAKAITCGDGTYRTIAGILAAGAETDPAPAPAGDGGAPAHLRGPGELFATATTTATGSDEQTRAAS